MGEERASVDLGILVWESSLPPPQPTLGALSCSVCGSWCLFVPLSLWSYWLRNNPDLTPFLWALIVPLFPRNAPWGQPAYGTHFLLLGQGSLTQTPKACASLHLNGASPWCLVWACSVRWLRTQSAWVQNLPRLGTQCLWFVFSEKWSLQLDIYWVIKWNHTCEALYIMSGP